jgi:hypothetical protein
MEMGKPEKGWNLGTGIVEFREVKYCWDGQSHWIAEQRRRSSTDISHSIPFLWLDVQYLPWFACIYNNILHLSSCQSLFSFFFCQVAYDFN